MRGFLAAVLVVALPAIAVAEENVYKKALKSTVWITQPISPTQFRTGSGSVIDVQKRYVLTNHHVVPQGGIVTVFFPALDKKGSLVPEREKYLALLRDGGGIKGKVLFTEPEKDLAVIQLDKLPPGTPALRIAKEAPGPGDKVHSIGSPGASGALFNYTDGSVKAVYQKRYRSGSGPNDPNAFAIDAKVIETSSSTNKGDSGGPLMNNKVELVGVTQGMLIGDDASRPISYFIAVEEVREVLKKHKITLSNQGPSATAVADKPTPDSPTTTNAGNVTPAIPEAELREKDAAAKLDFAKDLASRGKVEKAKERLDDIVKKFAGTKAADEAKTILEKK
jgi:S1-C subfamily serine protease